MRSIEANFDTVHRCLPHSLNLILIFASELFSADARNQQALPHDMTKSHIQYFQQEQRPIYAITY